jgi:hypothetical protein
MKITVDGKAYNVPQSSINEVKQILERTTPQIIVELCDRIKEDANVDVTTLSEGRWLPYFEERILYIPVPPGNKEWMGSILSWAVEQLKKDGNIWFTILDNKLAMKGEMGRYL